MTGDIEDAVAHVMRIKSLVAALQMMLDTEEAGAGHEANAHAFELSGMILDEANVIERHLYATNNGGAA